MKLHFHGAARTVTGSLHIVETARGEIVLLDCGLFQGRRAEARERNTTLPIEPARVKAVLLSHAHIDHIGNLPTWAARGLRCPVYGTAATVDLAALLLRDSAHIQVLDALHINRKYRRGEESVVPLYQPEDAERAIALLRGSPYREWFDVLPGLRTRFSDAGHILGSASITLEERANGSAKRLAFTGDAGRPDSPILKDPEPFPAGADVVISECTYGDRDHPPQHELPEELRRILYRTVARGGRVIIPAFAVGRTQTLMYALRELHDAGKLPELPVYVDSPLATGATEVFTRHPECYDAAAMAALRQDGSIFALNGFTATRSTEESKALNDKREPCVIIAASGMCEAGRILHHLERGLGNPRNTILMVGFQAENTLGRRLADGLKTVRVFGQEQFVRAEVVALDGFSAHAGQSELAAYLERCRGNGPLFLVHGEEPRALAFKEFIQRRGFADVRIPGQGEEFKV